MGSIHSEEENTFVLSLVSIVSLVHCPIFHIIRLWIAYYLLMQRYPLLGVLSSDLYGVAPRIFGRTGLLGITRISAKVTHLNFFSRWSLDM